MSRISRKSINELRQSVDIVALAGDYTLMKQRGRDWWGLSPFKSEKSPSFKVNPETGLWYCFSTQQGGDVFKLVMTREGLDFPESVERVATRFGFKLEYENTNDKTNEKSFRGQLLEIHEFVKDYWQGCFHGESTHGQWVRNYWTEQRHFRVKVAEDFGIGFAPIDDSNLLRLLIDKGYNREALAQTGLFFGTERHPDPIRWRCRFRGRLIIPINDIQGRVIAFTARKLEITPQDDSSFEAKYINSPETELFKKSRTVFNLDRARITRKNTTPFVIVEGQLDAIRCHSVGIPGVVAAQGTAITDEHFQQLRRFSQHLIVFLDSDSPGQKAALRLLPIGLKEGLDIRFLTLPDGKDPDEYFAVQEGSTWPSLLASARSAMQFCVQSLIPKESIHLPLVNRLNLLETLFPILEQAGAEEIVLEALNEAARHAGIGRGEMYKAYQRHRAQSLAHRSSVQLSAKSDPNLFSAVKGGGLTTPEIDMIHFLLHHEEYFVQVAQCLPLEWIDTSLAGGQLLLALCNEAINGHFIGVREALNHLNDDMRTEAARMSTQNILGHFDKKDVITQANIVLKSFHDRHFKSLIRQLEIRITSTPREEISIINELQGEKIALRNAQSKPPKLTI